MASAAAAAQQQVHEEALAKLPGLPAPPGDVHNFVNPYSLGWLIVFTSAITLAASTLFIVIRLYTKRFLNKAGLQWEDYISTAAWAGYVVYTSVAVQAVKYGGYIHQWNVPALKVMKFLQVVSNVQIMYCPVMFLTKLSLLLQVMHIFAANRAGKTYYLCLFMILINFLFYGIIMFVAIFVCSPRHKFWNPTVPGHCLNISSVNIITCIINAVSDLVLLLVPITCVCRLQMTLRKKIGVSAVFATAAFACICSIMRMVASIEVHGAKDITWVITPEGLWAHGELSCGIICGCMPVLPQFFRHFVPKITSYLSSGKSSTDKASAGSSNRGGERMRKKSVVPHLDTQVYMELDDHTQLKPTEDNGVGPKVWADEVLAEDEEKALPPFAEDAITAISQRHQYYNGR